MQLEWQEKKSERKPSHSAIAHAFNSSNGW